MNFGCFFNLDRRLSIASDSFLLLFVRMVETYIGLETWFRLSSPTGESILNTDIEFVHFVIFLTYQIIIIF